MQKSKKSETGLLIVLVIIIVLFFFGWLINLSQRECRTNRDCDSESYCGSDFACHQYPVIQRTIVQYNFFWPAVVLGIAIIIAAWIFRQPKEVTIAEKPKEEKEVEDISEPY